jgi:maleate isomerase
MQLYHNQGQQLRRLTAAKLPEHPEGRQRPGGSEAIRFGLLVPSSNVTMERELTAMFARRQLVEPEQFSFHSSRVRMRNVTPQELAAMNAQATRATQELADASVDVLVYACLVALMAEGPGAHRHAEKRLADILAEEGNAAPVVSSAGGMVDTLRLIEARRVAVIAPYLPALTQRVCDYIAAEDVVVAEARSLSVADNSAVGRLDPQNLLRIAEELPRNVDVVVISACVQMPSLPVIEAAEARLGLPVISSSTATAFQSLRRLGLSTRIPGAGYLLSGAFDTTVSLAGARG